MQRRVFLAGSALAALAAIAARGLPRPGTRRPQVAGADPLPDGRSLVRGAALAFGTTVTVAAVHGEPGAAARAVHEALAAIQRVDALMTVYRPESEVSRLNAEGALADPDPHLVRVLEFSQALAEASGGAFDVTVQPLWTLFAGYARAGRLPAPDEVERARGRVGWQDLEVSSRRVALRRPGMAVTLNGVAQGYATDLALEALRARGIRDLLVDAGEHGADGARQPGAPWTVGLQHPRDPEALLGAVAMDGRALAVSGDYATSFSADLLHHHVFDPRTGDSPPGLSTVAVAAPSGLVADGLTKPMMVLPWDRALALLARYPGSGALLFDKSARLVAAQGLTLLPAAAPDRTSA
jgi:thiamine biosynthesis lipoprotein